VLLGKKKKTLANALELSKIENTGIQLPEEVWRLRLS
jgi:hypothetical protein